MRAQTLAGIVSVGTMLFGFAEVAMSQTSQPGNVRHVVLVHGGWVDGSGWEGVYKALKKSGYAVTIVQEATTSLADDVATQCVWHEGWTVHRDFRFDPGDGRAAVPRYRPGGHDRRSALPHQHGPGEEHRGMRWRGCGFHW